MTYGSSRTKRFMIFVWKHDLAHEHFQDQSINGKWVHELVHDKFMNRLVHELPFIVHEIFMYTFMYTERKVKEPFGSSTAICRSLIIHEISP